MIKHSGVEGHRGCGAQIDELRYRGPVLIAEGAMRLDEVGRIVAIGPARAINTIKAGEEFGQVGMTYICPLCRGEGPVEAFQIVQTCALTGKEADVNFRTEFGVAIWIASDARPIAERVFTIENAAWDSPL